jgi:hypothetical protein
LIFAYGREQRALVLNPFEDIDRPEVASPPLVATARIDDHLIILGIDAADSAFDRLRGHALARGIRRHTRDGDLLRCEFRMLSKRFGQRFQEGLFFRVGQICLGDCSRIRPIDLSLTHSDQPYVSGHHIVLSACRPIGGGLACEEMAGWIFP